MLAEIYVYRYSNLMRWLQRVTTMVFAMVQRKLNNLLFPTVVFIRKR